ncbi:MAG TPA: hypothetical protein VIX13_05285, partial [Candidatus Eisenbacteria bacterium]
DWPGGEREFRRAIELNPNYPDARAFYSHLLNTMQRPKEAMTQIKRALELDPFNALFRSVYVQDLVYWRRYDDAIAEARDILRTARDNPVGRAGAWTAYFKKGMYREALAEVRWLLTSQDDAAILDRGYAAGGYPGAMRSVAEALVARSRNTYVNPTDVATLYAHAGETDRTLEWLEKGFQVHDQNMPYMGWPDWDGVRSDPRFQDLLRRMKLPL